MTRIIRHIPILHILATAMMVLCGAPAALSQLTFAGSEYKVIDIKGEASTGLDNIYVIYDTGGVTATYKAKTDRTVTWNRFSNLGGGHAEEIPCLKDGNNYSIELGNDDAGYIIDEGTDRYYCWVVNYANHKLRLEALEIADEQECDRARLTLVGNAQRITYYTINGAGKELSRDLTIDYKTLQYDADNEAYQQIPASQTFTSIDGTMGVFAPLCDTSFTLTGDRFLQQWGIEQSVESPYYQAIAVEAQTSAVQEARDNENEQKVDAELGGSAPVTITFKAVVSDAAIFREWQMTSDPLFEVIDYRYPQLEFSYTFNENGNTYVRFIADNAGASCEYEGETYEVFIGDSGLLCPNAFSPNGDGVNDEWRVSYKSIVEYECHIYNRWGQEMMASTDPAQGWDGRHKGKLVPTGAYYYIIKAKGSDGRKYNLKGDINIIKSNHTKTETQGGNE